MDNVFGKYRIAAPIKKKASNPAYRARLITDSEWDYVVKVFTDLPSAEGEEVFRHSMEEWLSQLDHTNILPIIDYGIENGYAFYVTRYMTKGSLRDYLERQSFARISLQDIFTIIEQIGQALQYAHNRHILHGNLKPENVLFKKNGAVLLTGFSLPENPSGVGEKALSKEQLTYYPSSEPLSEKSDQYVLACLADELFSKLHLSEPSSFFSQRQDKQAPTSVQSVSAAEMIGQIKARLMKAMATDPDQRYENIVAFVEALDEVCDPFVAALFLPATTVVSVGVNDSSRRILSMLDITSRPLLKQHLQVRGTSRHKPLLLVAILLLVVLIFSGFAWQLLARQTKTTSTFTFLPQSSNSTATAVIGTPSQPGRNGTPEASPTAISSTTSPAVNPFPTNVSSLGAVPISWLSFLAGYWKFEEGSGSVVYDSSNNAYTGTLRGHASWGPPRVGSLALSLDGTDGTYVDIPTPVIDITQNFSIAAWVKLNTLGGSQTFISLDGNQTSAFFLQWNAGTGKFAFNRLASDADTALATIASAGSAPVVGVWYHLVGVYDTNAQTISLYVNGVLQQIVNYDGSWQTATGHTVIGRGKFFGLPRDYVNGEIDDVYICRVALAPADVMMLAKMLYS